MLNPNDIQSKCTKSLYNALYMKHKYVISTLESQQLPLSNHTALSFVELVKYLFKLPGSDASVFLSQRLSQDPLENFFGCQRQRGGAHDNPNVQEFQKNMQALRVVNSFVKGPVKRNCRGSKDLDKVLLEKENTPLPKRKPARNRK